MAEEVPARASWREISTSRPDSSRRRSTISVASAQRSTEPAVRPRPGPFSGSAGVNTVRDAGSDGGSLPDMVIVIG